MKRRSQRWLLWLLPFLVARAFVPAGFMLTAVAGDLSLMFCPGAGPAAQFAALPNDAAPVDHDHSHDHHAHHAQADSQSDTDAQHSNHFGAIDTSTCPFAVASVACSVNDFHVADARLDRASNLLPSYTAPLHANRAIRADHIRGPPASHG